MTYYAMQLVKSKELVETTSWKIYLFTDIEKCKSACELCYLLINCQPLEIQNLNADKHYIIY